MPKIIVAIIAMIKGMVHSFWDYDAGVENSQPQLFWVLNFSALQHAPFYCLAKAFVRLLINSMKVSMDSLVYVSFGA